MNHLTLGNGSSTIIDVTVHGYISAVSWAGSILRKTVINSTWVGHGHITNFTQFGT